MRKLRVAFLLIMVALFVTACSGSTSEVTTISINEDGSVEHTIIEEFDSTSDNIDALKQMILEKVASYNTSDSENQITVSKVEADGDDKVKVVMSYPDVTSFHDFNETDTSEDIECFYGTIEEAYDAGYDFSNVTVYQGGDTSQAISGDDILSLGSQHIFIYDNALNSGEPIDIKFSEKINYCSDSVTIQNKVASVDADAGTLIYLIVK